MSTPFEFSLYSLLSTSSGLPDDQAYLDFFREECRRRIFEANATIFDLADGKGEWDAGAEQRLRCATARVRQHLGFLRRAEFHYQGKPAIARQFASTLEAAEGHAKKAFTHARELAMMFDPLRTQPE